MSKKDWLRYVQNADSRDVLKRIPDNSIDFILTDPPYNIGKHSTGNIPLPGRSAINNDIAPWDLVDFNPEEWADEFVRILKPTGNLFIFTSYNQLGRWYNCLDHKFDTTNFMIWHKTNPPPKIFKAGFLNSCEMIFTCWNKKHTWNFSTQAEMHNFIESPICMRPERLSNPKHPAQKPVKILKHLIEIASNEGDIVFDPFMGVGSVGIAALELGRKFIGVDINPTYYIASLNRIDNLLSRINSASSMCDKPDPENKKTTEAKTSTLAPLLKWPGGKEKELKYILPELPSFDRYYEPFVGGGSVFMAVKAQQYFVNDLSQELITLYRNIAHDNNDFFRYAYAIDGAWQNARSFFLDHSELIEVYRKYQSDEMSKSELKSSVKEFCEQNNDNIIAIVENLKYAPAVLIKEFNTNLYRKMARMRDLEVQKQLLPYDDILDNIETAIKSAVYMYFRYLYNKPDLYGNDYSLYSALFLFIRNYAYSGMFRYNGDGEFNVPYGGIAYNSKLMRKKLDYYRSDELKEHIRRAAIYSLDFEEFLRLNTPTENDFIFLDPPYDSEFSTYANNAFTRNDQIRLANYLLTECHAKWLLVIKNTDFIFSLYNQPGINIRSFEKNYTVSFMNRNDKKVTHLIITNY